ncbi:hypothetical protein PVAP13_5NG441300 [Panicum virgatum]|uniref:protein-serine/threonine phosphatase n=1 Tax=Panicum virgatum TaxID=38727 RepID=A0A8T0RX82_PANVG|nr:hypothetical protein PVAP13_5NG441300 [Panicum virgatum]
MATPRLLDNVKLTAGPAPAPGAAASGGARTSWSTRRRGAPPRRAAAARRWRTRGPPCRASPRCRCGCSPARGSWTRTGSAPAPVLPLHLFGVYDGHGGSEVANYCRDRMHVVLKEALGRAAWAAGLEESGDLLDIAELWEKVFSGCFQRVDDEVSGQASRFSSGVGSEAQCKPVAAGDVGSTAAVAVVCSSHIIVANCGDSRVVLSRGKEPVALSDDHKPDREDERARIEAAGGRVIDWNGHRVSGVLAMSRSVSAQGDGYGKPFLIPTPEV